jgi:hypothetical protein
VPRRAVSAAAGAASFVVMTPELWPRTAFFSGGELSCNLLPLYPAPKSCGRGAREGRPGHAGDVLEEEAGFFSFSFTVRG